jgi:hypothetical protein
MFSAALPAQNKPEKQPSVAQQRKPRLRVLALKNSAGSSINSSN